MLSAYLLIVALLPRRQWQSPFIQRKRINSEAFSLFFFLRYLAALKSGISGVFQKALILNEVGGSNTLRPSRAPSLKTLGSRFLTSKLVEWLQLPNLWNCFTIWYQTFYKMLKYYQCYSCDKVITKQVGIRSHSTHLWCSWILSCFENSKCKCSI